MKNPTTDAGICLPGETGWELWKQNNGPWQCVETLPVAEGGGPSGFKEAGIFAFSVSAAFAVPVWAQTADEELVEGIVDMQIEKLNLRPETAAGRLLDVRTVEREENQTLALAVVLNPAMADDLPREAPRQFEVSPFLYVMPDNHLVIWRELGRIVLCVTRRDEPVYFHALTAGTLSTAEVHEMEHLLMPLYTQGIIAELDGAVLWTEAVEKDAAQAIANTFGVQVRSERRPAPKPPLKASTLEPVSVALGKIRAARAQRVKNIAATCVLSYLLVMGAFVAWWLYRKSQVDTLAVQKNGLQTQFGWVQDAVVTADLMDQATNFDKYPVEILRACIEPLYEANPGVRLTSFGIDKGHVTIRGEARDNSRAITYTNRIKGSKAAALQGFVWSNKPQPAKGDVTPFEITGKPISETDGTATPKT